MELFALIITIILIFILLGIYINYNFTKNKLKKQLVIQLSYKSKSLTLQNTRNNNELDFISINKTKIENFFDLEELKNDIDYYNKKETILYFHCEKLISKYYTKLLLLDKVYELNENQTIKIKINKNDVLNSDFNENIILKSEKEEINFIINICYNMNNHFIIK